MIAQPRVGSSRPTTGRSRPEAQLLRCVPTPPSPQLQQAWLAEHLRLLAAERDEEHRQAHLLLTTSSAKLLERNGVALLGLGVQSRSLGLGGKLLLELHRPHAYHNTHLLPPHTFRPGDVCVLQSEDTASSSSGGANKAGRSKRGGGAGADGLVRPAGADGIQCVVYKVQEAKIVVAVGRRSNTQRKTATPHASSSKAAGEKRANARSDGASAVTSSEEGGGGADVDIPARIRLVKVANDATYERMDKTMLRLAAILQLPVKELAKIGKGVGGAAGGGRGDASNSSDDGDDAASTASSVPSPSPLLLSLLGLAEPTWQSPDAEAERNAPLSASLNDSQRDAIRFAQRANHFALIHGPPGTGKTTVVAEYVRSLLLHGDAYSARRREQNGNGVLYAGEGPGAVAASGQMPGAGRKRVLICGASNLAADNLLERVLGGEAERALFQKRGIVVTRIGHPARVLPSLATSTLDHQSSHSSSASLLRDVGQELRDAMDALQPPPNRSSERPRSKLRGAERRQAWEEVRALRAEYRRRERRLVGEVVKGADVVVSTCHTAGGRVLDGQWFDVVVIDEACQALEAACWIPILRAKRDAKLILAGDHLQLPPTVKGYRHSTSALASKKSRPRKGKTEEARRGKGETTKSTAASTDSAAAGEVSADESESADEPARDEDESDVDDVSSVAHAFAKSTLRAGGDDEGGKMAREAPAETRRAASEVRATALRPPRSLETTLFSRLLGLYGERCKALLRVQYRMNEAIMAFPNEALYGGELEAHESCRQIRLRDLEGVRARRRPGGGAAGGKAAGTRKEERPEASDGDGQDDDEDEEEMALAPLVLIDTSAAEMREQEGGGGGGHADENGTGGGSGAKLKTTVGGESKSNANEAQLVLRHVRELVRLGVAARDICVLAPYSAQVSVLSLTLRGAGADAAEGAAVGGVPAPQLADVEVGTVDGMQGREAECVVVSLVRSNERGEVGFLAERRRLNVAMTRAKRQLCVVGDVATVGGAYGGRRQDKARGSQRQGEAYLASWMRFLEETAAVDVVVA